MKRKFAMFMLVIVWATADAQSVAMDRDTLFGKWVVYQKWGNTGRYSYSFTNSKGRKFERIDYSFKRSPISEGVFFSIGVSFYPSGDPIYYAELSFAYGVGDEIITEDSGRVQKAYFLVGNLKDTISISNVLYSFDSEADFKGWSMNVTCLRFQLTKSDLYFLKSNPCRYLHLSYNSYPNKRLKRNAETVQLSVQGVDNLAAIQESAAAVVDIAVSSF